MRLSTIQLISTKGLLLFITLLLGCSSNQSRINSHDVNFLVSQGDLHWEKRQNPEEARLAKFYYSKTVENQNLTLDLATRYIKACYFVGHYIETDETTKDNIFLEGANYALKYLHRSEAYNTFDEITTGDSVEVEILMLKSLDKVYVPIIYWWIANIGRYLIDKPIGERLKYTELVQAGLERIIELDPEYYYGGPYRLLGTFYVRIPGFDINLAQDFFQYSITKFPYSFSTSVLMAQYCSTKSGERRKFRELLENVINSDPNVIPEIAPENMFEQNFAKQLLKMEFLLFE